MDNTASPFLLQMNGYEPEPQDNIMSSLFEQYERVVMESLFTSFGLEALLDRSIPDQHGGDVDTIHSVRTMEKDSQMRYKNPQNEKAYRQNGPYNPDSYHNRNPQYKNEREGFKKQRQDGSLADTYTGKPIRPGEPFDTEHKKPSKEVHEDRGRILSGLKGTDLANSPENLGATSPHINRTKGADSMEAFLEKHGSEYTPEERQRMLEEDKQTRSAYERKIAIAYYTSSRFLKDTAKAAGKTGAKMAARQALGFVFAEIWFTLRSEFQTLGESGAKLDVQEFFRTIGNGIRNGFQNAMAKYKAVLDRALDGVLSGALASLTTTLCNIFFTTAKRAVRFIRETWASLVQALKILLYNPDGLPFGERIRAAAKVVAAGASVVAGILVSNLIEATPLGHIPVLGEIIQTFCGTLVAGILSCTLLYVLDRSELVQSLVSKLNQIPTAADNAAHFRRQAEMLEEHAAALMKIDRETFQRECAAYAAAAEGLQQTKSPEELNHLLKRLMRELSIPCPWGEKDFDDFMTDTTSVLTFG